MRNILQIIWFCLLIILFTCFCFYQIRKRVLRTDFVKFEQVNRYMMDSLKKNANKTIILLSISEVGCTPCNVFFKEAYVLNNQISPYYFELKTSDSSHVIKQALRTGGFPTTYIFDKELNLWGKVEGIRDFQKRLDEVIDCREVDSNTLMYRFALRALLSYWEGDFKKSEMFALKSVEQGSYFFNNYMMYLLAKPTDDEKAEYYKAAALSHQSKLDSFIYENLIYNLKTD